MVLRNYHHGLILDYSPNKLNNIGMSHSFQHCQLMPEPISVTKYTVK